MNDIYLVRYEYTDNFGVEGKRSAFIDVHPLDYLSKLNEEAQGHVEYSVVGWQRMTREDVEAIEKNGIKIEK